MRAPMSNKELAAELRAVARELFDVIELEIAGDVDAAERCMQKVRARAGELRPKVEAMLDHVCRRETMPN
jgi:hypothetical protein